MKVDIKAGDVIRSDGLQIEVKRSVKAGDSIPALFVQNRIALLSAEPDEVTKKSGEFKPWFTAFPENSTTNNSAAAIEAWRIENDYVGVTPATAGNGPPPW
jgi:hypothetical protein